MVEDLHAPIGITAYARYRGCTSAAVHKAIRAGRLRGSIVRVQGRTMLRSAADADREWEARTDRSRRPDYARMVAPQTAPLAPPLSAPAPGLLGDEPGAGLGDDRDLDTMGPAPILFSRTTSARRCASARASSNSRTTNVRRSGSGRCGRSPGVRVFARAP